MNQVRSVTHSTFAIERHYAAKPERVFAAFSDPAKKRRWYAQGGKNHEVLNYTMDFRVGGIDRSSLLFSEATPFPGAVLNNILIYQDIVPNQRIVTAYTMAFGDRIFSASQDTFELVANGSGTDLIFTEQAAFFEGSDGPEMRKGGWQTLLDALGRELGS